MFTRRFTSTVILLAVAASASAQPPPPPPAPGQGLTPSLFEGVVTVGGLGTDNRDYLGRVGEYDVLKQGALPAAELGLWGERGASRWDVYGRHSGDARDQRYGFTANIKRRLSLSASYDRMPHRLDHDPLTWMDASSNLGGTFVVQHTDNDPGARYELTRGELKARAEYTQPIAGVGSLKLVASHRLELRDGTHQVLTTNHCATCHTESFTRKIDQKTRDLFAGARLQLSGLTVDYNVTNRRFTEDTPAGTIVYDRAQQPATLADVFLNRVSYDERSGPLPFDVVPTLEKITHDLRARVSLPRDASLNGAFTRSRADNVDTGIGTDFTGGSGRFVLPIGRKLVVRAALRQYSLDTDAVFIDIVEPVAPAGPSAGLTYAQAFPQLGVVDYVNAGLSQSPITAGIDLVYRPWKKTTIRGAYEWEAMERGDGASVAKTTTNAVRGSIRSSPWKKVQFQVRAQYDWITDPFARIDAAMPEILQPYQSPGNLPFTGLQYFEFYRTRQATLTNQPARDGVLEQSLTWTPSDRASVSGHYRYRNASNDTLEMSTWSQAAHLPGAEVWLSPGGPVTLSAGYSYQHQRSDTGFATLAFVG